MLLIRCCQVCGESVGGRAGQGSTFRSSSYWSLSAGQFGWDVVQTLSGPSRGGFTPFHGSVSLSSPALVRHKSESKGGTRWS